jgi:hypothetical protein
MRKVYAGLFSSIDGVVEAPSEWQPGFDEEMGAAWSRMLEGQDAVLMGRVTFTEFAGYWPTSDDEPFRQLNQQHAEVRGLHHLGLGGAVVRQHADQTGPRLDRSYG